MSPAQPRIPEAFKILQNEEHRTAEQRAQKSKIPDASKAEGGRTNSESQGHMFSMNEHKVMVFP
jgi:hypothetical protein